MAKLNDTLKSIPNLKVKSVAKALDWSWLVDFGQGDFAQGKSAAEIALLNDWNPDTLLVRGIIHQLQGEYNQALFLFAEVFLGASSVEQKLIIATFAYLTEQKAQETLADDFAVSLSTSSPSNWLSRVQILKEEIPNTNLRLKTNFIEQIAKILPYFRTVIARQNNFVQKERYHQKIQNQLTRQLEIYQNAEIYAIAEFLYGVLAQILNLAGQIKPGWELLDHLTKAYSNSHQFLEAAWFSLNQGDLIVTIYPWGKPILFGYCVAEVITNPQGKRKLDRSSLDTNNAQQLYSQAREYFSMAQAPRGEAMAIMRLAYLNAVGGQWNLAAFGYQEAKQYFSQTGDILNSMAAEMGRLWSILQYQTLDSDCLVIIQEWTQWIQEQGAISWGMSFAFAFALAAEEALLVNQELEVALRLIGVAETIAIELENAQPIGFSVSCKQLWQSCLLILENVFQKIVERLALTNNWEQAFSIGEKVRIYGINPLENTNYLKPILSSVPTIKDLSNQLKPDVLLLAYLITDHALLIWGITQQGLLKNHVWPTIKNQPFQTQILTNKIHQWLKELSEHHLVEQEQKLLEKLFLQPFIKEINKANHIVIMPCKQLQGIPFSALKFHNIIFKQDSHQECLLGLYKSISYINIAQEIKCKNNISSTDNQVLIITEDGEFINNKSTNLKISSSPQLSLTKFLILAIINIYDFSANTRHKKEIVKTVHLFLSSKTLFLAKSMFQDLAADLAIVNIGDIHLNQFPTIELASLTRSIINAGTQTVVILFQGEFAIATAMLTLFFHKGLYRGYSVAQSLYQAQQIISRIKAQEAINFCRLLQSHIPWQSDSDRAIYALLTRYMGDILVLGGDYIRATQAYKVAINIFSATGYDSEARTLQENYQLFNSLQDISQKFGSDLQIFQSPTNWHNGFIFGDFSLKNIE